MKTIIPGKMVGKLRHDIFHAAYCIVHTNNNIPIDQIRLVNRELDRDALFSELWSTYGAVHDSIEYYKIC